jgi:hypothetical protein
MRKVLVYASIACGLAAASPASAAEIVRAGPGCADKSLAEKMFLARDLHHDTEAYLSLFSHGMASGICRGFPLGKHVEVDESSTFDLSCVRTDGDHECFWVLPSMVTR